MKHKQKRAKYRVSLAAATLTAATGLLLLGISGAATFMAAAEGEAGTLAGNAALVNDAAASGGAAVGFGTAPVVNGPTINLTEAGGVCDGKQNDQPALQDAINDLAGKGGGTIVVPDRTCRIVQTATKQITALYNGVAVRGAGSASTLALDSDVPGAYRELFRTSGAHVVLDNINLVRVSDVYGIFINITNANGLTLNRVTMDGRLDTVGGATFHGIAVLSNLPNTISKVRMTNVTIKNTDFGMFQSSEATASVDDWTVDNSSFSGNYSDDLEFNAPNSSMSHISVTNSRFSNNKANPSSYGAGFAIGFANVQHGLIRNNTISGYSFEGVHLEDRTSDVTVDGNTISAAGTSAAIDWASDVFVINDTHDVRITNNTFDTAANTNPMHAVYLGAGGGKNVHEISLSGNTFRLRPNTAAIGQYGTANVSVGNNTTVNLP